jgi:predicted DNA-binding transcriptional regulator AlpA
MSELLTTKEVAKLLRISKRQVQKHATGEAKPLLASKKVGVRGRLRFLPSDIEEFIKQLPAGQRSKA